MPERSADWYKQAAEKAVKAVYQKCLAEAWGHAVTDLLSGLKEKIAIPQDLWDKAKGLDKFYIPARYPNSWVSGFPAEYITRKDAEDAIRNSGEILRFCKGLLAK